jgi:hypothetical protein
MTETDFESYMVAQQAIVAANQGLYKVVTAIGRAAFEAGIPFDACPNQDGMCGADAQQTQRYWKIGWSEAND